MEKKRVLLVEDEKDMVDAMVFQLQAAGYEVVTAYDGMEGLDKAKKEKVDLVILDIMLPKMDGFKVCGILKKDSRYAKLPIILFSARAQAQDLATGKELGADAYIVKPFDSKVLLAKIKELIGG